MKNKGNIASWVIQAMLAVMFLMMAMPKLMGTAETIENFTRWGLPGKIFMIIGAFELLGAVGLLIPRLAGLAAVGLIMIMVGALYTHLTHGEYPMAVVPIMVMMMLGFIAYIRNPLGSQSVTDESIIANEK